MIVSDMQVKDVLEGNAERKFTQFGFSLLITRLTWAYKNNPTNAVLQECTKEINTFLSKYETIMKNDYGLFLKK
jgi:hypothetical protein